MYPQKYPTVTYEERIDDLVNEIEAVDILVFGCPTQDKKDLAKSLLYPGSPLSNTLLESYCDTLDYADTDEEREAIQHLIDEIEYFIKCQRYEYRH